MNDELKIIALILSTLLLPACHSVMPISDVAAAMENKNTGIMVIVYYDSSVGTKAIEQFIKKNKIEVLYRYNNINGYALKLQNDKLRTALERTKGVLSVKDDQVMRLQ